MKIGYARVSTKDQSLNLQKAAQKAGFKEVIFWFDAFVYNQIWEDPRVDLQALLLDENRAC